MDNNQYLYRLQDISFSYKIGNHEVSALRDISLNIPKRSLTTFSGPSGSGKSTLLNLLSLIEPLQGGEINFENQDFSTLSERKKNEIRKFHIGFIFQQFHLIPVLSAEENVAYFLHRQSLPKREIQERVQETLNEVGLWEHRFKKPKEMSGGQMQRVAIARAIAKEPKVIIGDEPTANLDQETGKDVMTIFQKLVEEKEVSIILTTHDEMVKTFSTTNFHIQDGLLK